MKRFLEVAGILSIALFVIALVYAQQNEGQSGGKGMGMRKQGQFLIQKFDTNQDGQIAQQEWIAVFKSIDLDGDGILNQEELAKYQGQIRQEIGKNIFQRFDKNGDGFIGKDEFPGRAEKFALLDANSDGQISSEEMKAAGEQMRKMKGEGGKVRKMKGGDPNSVQ